MEDNLSEEVIELEVTEAEDEAANETAPNKDFDMVIVTKRRADKAHFSLAASGYSRDVVEDVLTAGLDQIQSELVSYEMVLEPTYKELEDGQVVQGAAVLVTNVIDETVEK